MRVKLEWWRWIPFWFMIFGLFLYAGVSHSSKLMPPTITEIPSKAIVDEEYIDYIFGTIDKYIDQHDFISPEEMMRIKKNYQPEANDIGKIIEGYGIKYEDYGVGVSIILNSPNNEHFIRVIVVIADSEGLEYQYIWNIYFFEE